jgi:hypothetical protein
VDLDDLAMQSPKPWLNPHSARLLAEAEQRVLRAELPVARQSELVNRLKQRPASEAWLARAERVLAILQANLAVHRQGLRIRCQIERVHPAC